MKKISELAPYISYPFYYQRRPTKAAKVKNLYIGGEYPIVLQSMLTCPSSDSLECLKQIKALLKVGCQMVRLSIMHQKDLAAMPKLRQMLKNEGIDVPLVADVHFAANLANAACEFFDKVRINPGNFSDRPKNHQVSKNIRQDFEEGKLKLAQRIKTLAVNLKKYDRALRIGVNQGSLSLRMIEKFGDTPFAMVYSALEAADLFYKEGVTNIVVSLKSSNPLVANRAYRLFAEMNRGGGAIPLHLGVTEAGSEQIGRVKSLCGIGPLLADGIGDTIRISLTEDSVNEILFAKKVKCFVTKNYYAKPNSSIDGRKNLHLAYRRKVEDYRNNSFLIKLGNVRIGGASNIKIGVSEDFYKSYKDDFLIDFAYQSLDKRSLKLMLETKSLHVKILKADRLLSARVQNPKAIFCLSDPDIKNLRLVLSQQVGKSFPVGMLLDLSKLNKMDEYHLQINTASIISEGLVDFILLPQDANYQQLKSFMDVLQATRVKLFETDYVACPSCGRTTFDLQKVTKKIKNSTKHLKGLKIGILGCMVNGPGEMADADFGYVGSSKNRVDLYLGQTRVKQNVPSEFAVDELVKLIKQQGLWAEPT